MTDPAENTSDPQAVVRAAARALDTLAERPLAAHVEAFERVHLALTEALAAGAGDSRA
ncbi:MAG TPA: hypothetical protein VM367_04780 [Pseudonocardia sp.]|jgi:hypothetical protein|nr:hypothetical protein [Pseudonocardia sp.]